MARSKSDISNSAIRIFLQDVGRFYDEARGFEPFGPRVAQTAGVFFQTDFRCSASHKGIRGQAQQLFQEICVQ